MELPPSGEAPVVELWYFEVGAAEVAAATAFLVGEELEQLRRFRSREAAARFAVRRGRARQVVAERLGVAPGEVVITRQCSLCGDPTHGKPRVAGANLAYSASASSRGVVVAVADEADVGVDVEAADRRAEMQVIRMVCTEREQQALSRVADEAARSRQFLRYWCRKEAVLKLVGVGLPGEPRLVECTDVRDDEFSPVSGIAGSKTLWLRDVELDPAVIAAVAATTPAPVEVRRRGDAFRKSGGRRRGRVSAR